MKRSIAIVLTMAMMLPMSVHATEGTVDIVNEQQITNEEGQTVDGVDQPVNEETQPVDEQQPVDENNQTIDTQEQPAEDENQSTDEETQPTEDENQFTEEEQQPIEDENQSAEEEKQPIQDDNQSAEEEQQPADDEEQSVEEEQQPAEDENQPVEEEQQSVEDEEQSVEDEELEEEEQLEEDKELLEEDELKEDKGTEEEQPEEELNETGRPIPEEYLMDAEGNDLELDRIEAIGDLSGSDEIIVGAVAGHGTIESDPMQENAYVSNNTKITLKFKLRSYGNSLDDFTIMVYKKGSKVPLAKKVGTFSDVRGYSDYYFIWDTTNLSKYQPGTYEILCFSSYETEEGRELNEEYSYYIHLEDYQLVATRNFVSRLYQKVLGRKADANGLKSWTNALYYKQKTGAQVASQFVFSSEFINKNLSDEAYVTVLYQAILGRDPDAAGLKVWKEALDAGMTRWGVLKGFIASTEFDKLCKEYGITKGRIDTNESRDLNAGATSFVGRIYSKALGRKADVAGLNYWTGCIINKTYTPAKVAKGFIFSKEFTSKNLSDAEYVKTLYRVFMGREADLSGLNYWVGQLESGQRTRENVFNGFAGSKEFQSIIASYHL